MEKEFIRVGDMKSHTKQSRDYDSQHLRAWLRLIRDKQWSRRQKHQLLKEFESPERIYQATDVDWAKVITGRGRRKQNSFIADSKVSERMVDYDLRWLDENKAHCVTINSPNYPCQLSHIVDAPLALFAVGDVSLLNEPQVAIVGSRRPTPIGAKLARQFAQELSGLGIVITSGMALGVDGLSHKGALDQGQPTIAVMGCGLDVVYPARHKDLFARIKENGLLVSEYPIGIKASRHTFPERNRIVSGLSLGVVIIEAAIKSGTMITARLAIEQNRELMVLPGSAVSAQYQGSHSLLRDGAGLVSSSDDILFSLKDQLHGLGSTNEKKQSSMHEYKKNSVLLNKGDVMDGAEVTAEQEKAGEDAELNQLLELIGAEPVSVEMLIMGSGLTPARVSSMLLMMELEDKIAVSDDGGYINIS